MKKNFTAFLLFISLILLLPCNLFAQQSSPKIHPTLQVVLIDASANEIVDVYAKLNEQYSFEELKLQTQYLSKKEKQKDAFHLLLQTKKAKEKGKLITIIQPNI